MRWCGAPPGGTGASLGNAGGKGGEKAGARFAHRLNGRAVAVYGAGSGGSGGSAALLKMPARGPSTVPADKWKRSHAALRPPRPAAADVGAGEGRGSRGRRRRALPCAWHSRGPAGPNTQVLRGCGAGAGGQAGCGGGAPACPPKCSGPLKADAGARQRQI
ncbi:MAG: hypothetical protein J3K34DRAFT_415363 [Monoraphidium minutum]|nr:MAG: hypothetical protein J3K34DRAFT_415363 [Monoraphidium minutum]